ncbi:hypothetical protein NW765_015778 [Fusarium oxysporum]|nr:hypothetical protein NW765_015778 [Fusarium oxysporum]
MGGPQKPVKSQRGHAAQKTATAQRTLAFLGVSAEQKHTAQHNSTGTAQVARDLPPETYDWSEAGFKWQWADGWR